MAYWSFTDSIMRGKAIPVFGKGKLRRDFTHVSDIVAGLVAIMEAPFREDTGQPPHRIYNLGNNNPVEVLDLIRIIENATGRTADIVFADGPPGDVNETYADITLAARDYNFAPRISLAEGIPTFVDWFKRYHNQ
jgi:UDP-glucuronate 4-epimerase